MNFVLGFVVLAVLIAAPERTHYQPGRLRNRAGALCGRLVWLPGRDPGGERPALFCGQRYPSMSWCVQSPIRQISRSVGMASWWSCRACSLDTWQDEQGQTHMDIGFTVYGIERTRSHMS